MQLRKYFLVFSVMGLIVMPSLSQASTVTASQLVTISGTTANNRFGRSVVSGDFTGDGVQDIVSSAPYTASTTYIAITPGSTSQLSALTVSSSNSVIINGVSSLDNFGANLAVGDINNDGFDDLVCTAATDTDGGTNAGAIYILYGRSGGFSSGVVSSLTSVPKITGSVGQLFGGSLSVGDVNGDGYDDIAAGAPQDGGGGAQAGAVFVIYGSGTVLTSSSNASFAKLTGEAADDNFGISVAVGDISGDGFADVVGGAPGNDDNGSGAGAAYVLYGASSIFSGTSTVLGRPELVGEAVNDGAGKAITISRQNVAGDTYADLLLTAPGNDDGASNAGSVYVVPGSSTVLSSIGSLALGSSSYIQLTGETASDTIGSAIWSEDINQDGLADVLVASEVANSNTGVAYMVPGSASLVSASLSTGTKFTGASASDTFGKSIYAGDINNDGFPDLLVGANTYSAGGGTGAVYLGYLYIDADGDGVAGTSGVLATGADCNDSDATVSSNQTYYVDEDGDGNGSDTSAEFCSSSAPEGYSSNSDDTNDTIPNAGIEITGDEADNDGDSIIDEPNTLAENGEHPYFSTLDPAENASANILSVVGIKKGKVRVTYADNAVYDYTVFSTSTSQITTVHQFKHTGFAVALHQKGKKLKLLHLYTGEKADSLDLVKKKQKTKDLLLDDVRDDGKIEAIVTTKQKATVHVFVVRVKKTTGTIKLLDSTVVRAKNVKVAKTKVKKNFILLRNANGGTVVALKVKASYHLMIKGRVGVSAVSTLTHGNPLARNTWLRYHRSLDASEWRRPEYPHGDAKLLGGKSTREQRAVFRLYHSWRDPSILDYISIDSPKAGRSAVIPKRSRRS